MRKVIQISASLEYRNWAQAQLNRLRLGVKRRSRGTFLLFITMDKIMEQGGLKRVVSSFINAILATAMALFIPAWDFFWRQAWVFMALFFVPMALITVYLFNRSPELLKRRMNIKEKKPGQSIIAKMFYISVCLVFVISGFDKRFRWSSIPPILIIVSDILFLAAYFFLFLVFKENKYLAHTVVVEEKQEVVSTGPYAVVRHPMYFAQFLMFIFAALALGSYWALLANVILLGLLIVRIITEEGVLLNELKGYAEYTKKTRFRLIPGVW